MDLQLFFSFLVLGARLRAYLSELQSMAEKSDEQTLQQRFQKVFSFYEGIINGNGVDASEQGNDVTLAISATQKCIQARRQASLFSKNEEMDDFQTGIIKYLYLEYFLGKFFTQCNSLDKRAYYLQGAKQSFEVYLERCCKLRLLHEEEVAQYNALFPGSRSASTGLENEKEKKKSGFDGEDEEDEVDSKVDLQSLTMKAAVPTLFSAGSKPITSEMQRNMKVGRFKRERETKKRMHYLQEKISARSSSSAAGEDELGQDEEGERELYVLQMQSYARDVLDEVPLIEQELVMLNQMQQMRDMQSQSSSDGSNSRSSNTFDDSNDPTGVKRQNLRYMPTNTTPMPESHGKGIEVTRTGNGPDGGLVMQREVVKANVFIPEMEGPSMTIEQYVNMGYV